MTTATRDSIAATLNDYALTLRPYVGIDAIAKSCLYTALVASSVKLTFDLDTEAVEWLETVIDSEVAPDSIKDTARAALELIAA